MEFSRIYRWALGWEGYVIYPFSVCLISVSFFFSQVLVTAVRPSFIHSFILSDVCLVWFLMRWMDCKGGSVELMLAAHDCVFPCIRRPLYAGFLGSHSVMIIRGRFIGLMGYD